MTTGEPRGLGGNDGAVLEAVRLTARRLGLSVSDWLSELVARRAGTKRRSDPDEEALAAVIQDLARPIGGMDADQPADLDDRLAEAAARPGSGARSRRQDTDALPTQVAEIVEDVSSNVDDADETARSTVEGAHSGWDRTPARHLAASEATASPQGAATPDPLGAIQARIEALLAATPETQPETALEATLRSLESHLEEVNRRLFGETAAGDPPSTVAEESARQRSIDEAGDSVLAGGQRPISNALGSRRDVLSAFADPVAMLPDPVQATPDDTADRLGAIEVEIAALRQTVETVEGGIAAADDASKPAVVDAIARLEVRLDAVVARIEALDRSNPHDAISELKGEVAKIRNDLGDSQLTGAAEIKAQIASLARKLDAASESDLRAQEALSAVQATLERVVERLPELAGDRGRTAVAVGAFKATGTYGAGWSPPRAGLSAMDDCAPSPEPDVIKPDLAALRELARSAANGGRDETSGLKADFIAAARRATRAAAGEEPSPTGKDVGNGKLATFARISQAIRGRRRALLVLVAAPVVAVSAGHILGIGAPTSDERSQTAVATTISTQAVGQPGEGPAVATPSAVAEGAGPGAERPSTDSPAAFAFAAPERIDGRFDDAAPSPPTRTFVRPPYRAASLPLDEAIGSAALRRAAAGGDANAAAEVAARYAEGRLVPRDVATAALWYAVAAESGVAVAQHRLASLYERGHGVAKDLAVAATWYRRAAEQGNVGAMHNLGVMLSSGIEVPANYGEAVDWFRAAGDRGVEDSQYNLGVIYARGLGLDRDLIESYKWFALAAASGDPEAAAHRDEVGGALAPDDLAKARAIVGAWRPKPTSADANAVASLPVAWRDPSAGISEAERRSLVMKIQALLAEQGYDPGPADGLEGPKTRKAVRAFQRNIGLTETGKISNDVVAALADPAG